ncbi:hypothetical protein HAX54_033986 [Datura stramonium]|uniref:Uncharacterized protein n=1 Tax=Datura stramonium TaxID=4076 RepID=A0ABS8VGS0_DATST|nr:hypothetical protein [Datura stramonium]
MLEDAFIEAHTGAKKRERILLPPILDEWMAEAFNKGINQRSSSAYSKLKKNLLKFSATTWIDIHNRYESKIRVEDDQLDPSTSLRSIGRNHLKKLELRFKASKGEISIIHPTERSRDRIDREHNGQYFQSSERLRFDRRNDHSQNNRSLLNKEGPPTLGLNNI